MEGARSSPRRPAGECQERSVIRLLPTHANDRKWAVCCLVQFAYFSQPCIAAIARKQPADSTGRCNGSMESFCWCVEAPCLSRTFIESSCYGIEFSLRTGTRCRSLKTDGAKRGIETRTPTAYAAGRCRRLKRKDLTCGLLKPLHFQPEKRAKTRPKHVSEKCRHEPQPGVQARCGIPN